MQWISKFKNGFPKMMFACSWKEPRKCQDADFQTILSNYSNFTELTNLKMLTFFQMKLSGNKLRHFLIGQLFHRSILKVNSLVDAISWKKCIMMELWKTYWSAKELLEAKMYKSVEDKNLIEIYSRSKKYTTLFNIWYSTKKVLFE